MLKSLQFRFFHRLSLPVSFCQKQNDVTKNKPMEGKHPVRYASLGRMVANANKSSNCADKNTKNNVGSSLAAMRDDYNERSAVQQKMINLAQTYIERGIEAHSAKLDGRPVTIADFGSSTGANSSLAMSCIIEGLRKKYGFEGTRTITAVHNDLPSNNWTTTFNYIHSDPDSYLKKHKGVFAMASGLNFYRQILPPSSLHFGFSNYALHWLSKLPTKIANHCYYMFGTPQENEAFRKVAAQDWKDFLTARSAELVQGGVLVLHCLTVREPKPISPNTLYQSAKKLRDRGFISDEELVNYNVRIYFRTLAELTEQPLIDNLGLEMVTAETLPVSTLNPTFEAYLKHRDLDLYAAEFTKFIIGACEPGFHEALLPTRDKARLSEMLWLEYRNILKAHPIEFGSVTKHMFVILKKK